MLFQRHNLNVIFILSNNNHNNWMFSCTRKKMCIRWKWLLLRIRCNHFSRFAFKCENPVRICVNKIRNRREPFVELSQKKLMTTTTRQMKIKWGASTPHHHYYDCTFFGNMEKTVLWRQLFSIVRSRFRTKIISYRKLRQTKFNSAAFFRSLFFHRP